MILLRIVVKVLLLWIVDIPLIVGISWTKLIVNRWKKVALKLRGKSIYFEWESMLNEGGVYSPVVEDQSSKNPTEYDNPIIDHCWEHT